MAKKPSKHRHDSDSDSSDASDSSKKKSQQRRSGSSSSRKPRQRSPPGRSRSLSPEGRRRAGEKNKKASREPARSRRDEEDRFSTHQQRYQDGRSRERESNSRSGSGAQRAREESNKREKGRENRELKENPRLSQESRRDRDRERGRDDSRVDHSQRGNRVDRDEKGRAKSPERKSRDSDYSSQSRSNRDRGDKRDDKHCSKVAKKSSSSRDLTRGKEDGDNDEKDERASEKRSSERGGKQRESKPEKDRKNRSSKRKDSTSDSSKSDGDSDSSSEEEESFSDKKQRVKSPSSKEKSTKESVRQHSKELDSKKSGTVLDNKEKERRNRRREEDKSESSDLSSDERDKKLDRHIERREESRSKKKGRGSLKRIDKTEKKIMQNSSHDESEEEKHGSTPEKTVKISERKSRHSDEEDRVSGDEDEEEPEKDEEEEKEEGEISEEEEDVSRRPLIAISEDISEISTDEDEINMKDGTEEISKGPASKDVGEASLSSKKSLEVPPKLKSATSRKPRQKEENNVQPTSLGDTKARDLDKADEEVIVSSREKERPILESESDEEEDPKGLRSHVQSKRQVGSSVSVVNKRRETPRKRSRSRSRERSSNEDRDRGRRGKDERRKSPAPRKSHRDLEREKKDKETEGKQSQDGEAKTEDAGSKMSKDNAAKDDEKGAKKPQALDLLTRTGGAYIPPAKLRMLQAQITDKTSEAYQRISWEALKKSINGLINKVNVPNIIEIIKELFQENIVRGRGLLSRSVIQAQAASPTFTHVYAALVAVINTKFPQNGELILKRLVLTFKRGFRRNDKGMCMSSTRFIAHLINQQVAHEVLALEILTLLLESPTDDSVEVCIGFLKECGQKLTEVSSRAVNSIFERLRNVLHEGSLDKRVQYMIEVMFAIRKDGFKDFVAVMSELDLVEEEEQFTHLIQLEDAINGEEILNVFKVDPNFAENEEKYKSLKREILEEGSSDEGSSGSSGSESSSSDDEGEDEEGGEKKQIIDQTETNLVALRRTIYLTVQSSLDHNECAHKILKRGIQEGEEIELCNMILDCCAQLRTYEQFFGLLAQRFCQIDRKYIGPFQQIFQEQYETIHRLETNKIRNIAKLFAHLLYTDAISWGVLSIVKLTESDTTSASRIFLKILFQELSEFMGILKLNDRLKDPTLLPFFEGVMPRNNHNDTRFAINFFTTIGLGGLTDDLREHLKSFAKQMMQKKQEEEAKAMQQAHESSSSSEESDSSSSDSESSSSESEDSSPERKKRKKKSSKKRKSSEKSKIQKEEDGSKKKKRSKKESSKSRESLPLGKTIADRLLDMAQYGNMRNARQEERAGSKDGWNDRASSRRKEPAQRPERNEDEYRYDRQRSGDRQRLDSGDQDPRRNEGMDGRGQGDQRQERRYSGNEERGRMGDRMDLRQERFFNQRADRGRGGRNFNQGRDQWSDRGRADRNWNDQGRMQRGRNEREERGQRYDDRWRGQDARRQEDSGWKDLNDDRWPEKGGRWRDGPRMARDRDARGMRDGNSRSRPEEAFDRRNASWDGKENMERFDREYDRGHKRGRSPDHDNDGGRRQVKRGRQDIENGGRGDQQDGGNKKRSALNQEFSDIDSDEESSKKGRKRPQESKHKTSSRQTSKKRKKSQSSVSHSSENSSSSSAASSESSSASSSSSSEEEDAPTEKRIIKRKVGSTSSKSQPQISSDPKSKQHRDRNERREREEEGVRNRRRK